jgi:CRISPR-associated endonuclease Csn1
MERIIGIDAGIASIGWSVLEGVEGNWRIVGCGTRMFDAPETDKERRPTNSIRREKRGMRRVIRRRPTNSIRREKRGMRRVIRRRRQRMNRVRQLLHEAGLLAHDSALSLALGLDPWGLRSEALTRPLSPQELACVLGHIARHRGFRSNAKTERGGNAPDETLRMKSAIAATRERLGQWQTVGQMLACDPAFEGRKRNRGGSFDRSVLRDDQEHEVRTIFAAQQRMGNLAATEALAEQFIDLAFSQRPLQDSEHLVGFCPFLPDHRRAARRSHAFELFRLYARLNSVRITLRGAGERALTAEEIARAASDFGAQKKLTWKWLRKKLDLDPNSRFAAVSPEDEKNDFVARSGDAAEGSYAIRQAVGEAGWRNLLAQPAMLDRIAAILTFQADLGAIRAALTALPIEAVLAATLADAADAGRFNAFSRAGHISAAAARLLIPHMACGLGYAEACSEVGFDHAAPVLVTLEDVRNPVARKAVSEVLKQVKVLVHEYGAPDRIHLELARDVGKSTEERDEIKRGIERRNKERDRLRDEFASLLGRAPSGAEEMLRFELWKEQAGRCLYTDEPIPVPALVAGDNRVQVDHILPWSRFGDDSFVNKTLCLTGANAQKRGRTPYEWFSADRTVDNWTAFERRVEACKEMKGRKKRSHYLRRNAAEVEERFRARNLGDTRYATRLALDLLRRKYFPNPKSRTALARPGALTAKLRRGWGLEFIKKDAAGKRLNDDRHHALDAIIVAACSESMLQRLTRAFQEAEDRGRGRDFAAIDQPWPGFREQAQAAVEGVFVSRAERHRARGEAHAAIIKQVRERDGKLVVFERRAVESLKLTDLGRIKDPDRNAALIVALRAWIEADRPKDALPRSPKGDVVRKVRLATTDNMAVPVRGGTADRGHMARVDVFRRTDAKGRPRFYLVPIYPHQIATLSRPPNRAVDSGKSESEWTNINHDYTFLFSLYQNSWLEIVKPDGQICSGYFKGLDRSNGAISICDHYDPLALHRGIGARTLLYIRKFDVDRLGRRAEIVQETRTWRGAVCT